MGGFLTAQLAEWNDERGFGFLKRGPRRIFLHISDFSGAHRDLKVGETFRFEMGADAQGRTCAVNATVVRPPRPEKASPKPVQRAQKTEQKTRDVLRWSDAATLAALLALPTFSSLYWDFDWRKAVGWMAVASLLTFWVYGHDKRRAEGGGWRVAERSLHILELLGGWPGAFLAQRKFRHKCSKLGYQAVFWLIVTGYQFVAFDSLNDWRISKAFGAFAGVGKK